MSSCSLQIHNGVCNTNKCGDVIRVAVLNIHGMLSNIYSAPHLCNNNSVVSKRHSLDVSDLDSVYQTRTHTTMEAAVHTIRKTLENVDRAEAGRGVSVQ